MCQARMPPSTALLRHGDVQCKCVQGCLTPSHGDTGRRRCVQGSQVRRPCRVLPLAAQVSTVELEAALITGTDRRSGQHATLRSKAAAVRECNVFEPSGMFVRGGVCRKFVAEARFIQIVGAIQLLLAAWALLSSVSAGTQPLVACELHGCDAGVAKQSPLLVGTGRSHSERPKLWQFAVSFEVRGWQADELVDPPLQRRLRGWWPTCTSRT